MDSKFEFIKRFVITAVNIVLLYSLAVCAHALFSPKIDAEPKLGDFSSIEYNTGWNMVNADGTIEDFELPSRVAESEGDKVVLTNILPSDITDNMYMMFRASSQTMYIRIDGEVRDSYDSRDFPLIGENLAGGYIVIPLNAEDAGKRVVVELKAVSGGIGKINSVYYGYGNNVWYRILKQHLPLLMMAMFIILIGLFTIIVYSILYKRINISKSLHRMGILMVVLGVWVMTESKLRQLFMNNPSYIGIYSPILVSTIAIFSALFFDEVQKKRYTKVYTTISLIMIIQILVNIVLNALGLNFAQTLPISHFWSGIAILLSIIILAKDIKTGYVKEYKIIAVGMAGTFVSGVSELILYYVAKSYVIGTMLGLGFLFLLICTLAQVILDVSISAEKGRIAAENQKFKTIKTIANTIDAKDKYTGGHSERVGEYSRILCEAVKDKYNFTDDDANRIQYIGTLHDIGKIAVPDSVLNKNGKLTDDEFDLMKTHTSSGSDVLKFIDTIPGLLEGVRYHHERYDGAGYPDGLKGEEIPIFARILCIADCYDAMTSDRVYRKRLPDDVVYEEIKSCAGSQFDPELAKVFLELIDSGKVSPLGKDYKSYKEGLE